MSLWINLALDVLLIALVTAGLVQATRLMRHLAGLQQGRVEMERFVREFSSTVMRAESGITALRQAARDSGDDLEKLVEKALLVRDELHFIVESADQIAGRLSENASSVIRPAEKPAEQRPGSATGGSRQNENVTPFVAEESGRASLGGCGLPRRAGIAAGPGEIGLR